ncbi:hypothetical protein [Kibdelosporangium philippinense]
MSQFCIIDEGQAPTCPRHEQRSSRPHERRPGSAAACDQLVAFDIDVMV